MIEKLRAFPERVPLRVTLVAASLLLVTVALGASGETATYLLRNSLTTKADGQLRAMSSVMVQIGMRGGAGRQVIVPSASSVYQWIGDPYGNGTPTLYTTDSSEPAPALPTLTTEYVESKHNQTFTVGSVGRKNYRWRMFAIAFPDGSGVLVLGIALSDVDDTVTDVGSTLLLVDAAVLAALAVVGFGLVQASLRRLVEVERTAQAIAAGDLTRRIPRGQPSTEVGRLSAALNVMLGEIEAAFRAREYSEYEARVSEARMRRFAADASHELRTPLTAIRGFAELYRQGGGDPDHVITRIESHATRMGRLVDDLLLLARLDQQRPLEQTPVDLLVLAADAVQDAATSDSEHRIMLRPVADRPPVVLGDELRLRQVVGNIVTNAVRHTPAGTEITVTVDTVGGLAVLEVADTGPGLHPDDAARVFERFFRTDPARTRERGGSGLGLSIVQALVVAHGGQVGLITAPGEGARFVVRLPLLELTADEEDEATEGDEEPEGDSAVQVTKPNREKATRAYTGSSQIDLGELGHDADRDG